MARAYDKYRQLFEQNRYSEAADLAEAQFLQGRPNNAFWLTRQAAALSRTGEFQRALEAATKAYRIEPTNSYAVIAVGEALFGLNRAREALPYFETLLQDEQLRRHAHRKLLECLGALNQWERVLQHLEQHRIPSPVHYFWKVRALQELDRLDDAMQVCRQWLADFPDNRHGLWAMTELEIRRDGLEQVLSRMARMARIPSRPPVYKEIYASLCRRAGRPELALKQYQKMTGGRADPKIHSKQAFTLAKSGREEEAIPMFEELLKLAPVDVYLNSAYIAAAGRIGQLPRALAFYEKLLALHPGEKRLYGRIRKIKNRLAQHKPPSGAGQPKSAC